MPPGHDEPAALPSSLIHAASPSGIGWSSNRAGEDGLLIFTGRLRSDQQRVALRSRPEQLRSTGYPQETRSPFSDFTAKICMWLPGNAHEEIFDTYNGIG